MSCARLKPGFISPLNLRGSGMHAYLIPDNVVSKASSLSSLPARCQEGAEVLHHR